MSEAAITEMQFRINPTKKIIIMSGFYGAISKEECVDHVFYGTDYHSHMGTKRAGMVFHNEKEGFQRSIHSLESEYFRSKFEGDLKDFSGKLGMGVISDTDPQPIIFNSHLGKFAVVTVSRIVNIDELEKEFLDKKQHFTQNFHDNVSPTELIANLICEKDSFVEGIKNVHNKIKGSCSLLILTPEKLLQPETNWGERRLLSVKGWIFRRRFRDISIPEYRLRY